MKYLVTKTSIWNNEKPCDEAFLLSSAIFDERYCTEKYFNNYLAKSEGLWRSKGTNHKITKEGGIIRRLKNKDRWFIEINSLEELNKFIEKYGLCIIKDKGLFTQIPEIEIYDDYRE